MMPLDDHLSDEAFVDEIFRRFLLRPADPAGHAFYVGRLREGAARLDVLYSIVTGQEYFTHLCRQAFGPQTGNRFLAFAPPGHFYSPIPAEEDVRALAAAEMAPSGPDACPAVDLDLPGQLAWLDTLRPYTEDLRFSAEAGDDVGTRFHMENPSFAIGDAAVLAALMRHLRPARVVEAGAGLSTALMLDVAERHLGRAVRIETIDPDPGRLRALLRGDEDDLLTVHETIAQRAPLDLFTTLAANDILFIDSSHVLKLGSDLSFLLFQVLPRLAPGVFVHFHDIAWPFEYPLGSFEQGRAWNEAYALHAFLAHNRAFRIVLFADYLLRTRREDVRRRLPMLTRQPRGIPEEQHTACSLWLVRVA